MAMPKKRFEGLCRLLSGESEPNQAEASGSAGRSPRRRESSGSELQCQTQPAGAAFFWKRLLAMANKAGAADWF
jgi:hypothetical protein